MKPVIKIAILFILIVLSAIAVFIYRVTYGIPDFDRKPITIEEPLSSFNVLVYSKTNGFVHKKAIGAAESVLDSIARSNGWGIVTTRSAGVFNPEQLALFDLVIWNNVTGRTLTHEQRRNFKNYILKGGGFIGLHGAGDFSHHWDWYEDSLIGARFSHHTMNPQIQLGTITLECEDTSNDCGTLPTTITIQDEWYVFYENPKKTGAEIMYALETEGINPSGNFFFLIRDKNWGMGNDHPIIWRHCLGKGRSWYSALGHGENVFHQPGYLKMLEEAIKWSGGFAGSCDKAQG